MLPPFDHRGLLPPTSNGAPYSCTVEELRQLCVIDMGSPGWRVRLMNGWEQLRLTVSTLVPGTSWWVWGDLCTANAEPRFGDTSRVNGLAFLSARDVSLQHLTAAVTVLNSGGAGFYTDAGYVLENEGDPNSMATAMDAVESKWRPRATRWVFDDDGVDVGFIEVLA